MNFMLDAYPTDYKGYLIRTDYRIGVQISLCCEDVDLSELEKAGICFNLLYGNGAPDTQTALEGLQWFIGAGQDSKKDASAEPVVMSFEHDAKMIVSGFRRAYGIDLNRAKMHWFEFVALMGDLGECSLTGVIDIRTADLSTYKGKNRTRMEKLKQKYALPITYSREEQDVINKFFGQFESHSGNSLDAGKNNDSGNAQQNG